MKTNQFNIKRFWRLLRVKFAEEASFLLRLIFAGILVLLAIRIGRVMLSSGNFIGAFMEEAEFIQKIPGYTLLTAYVLGIKNFRSYFLCPVTNFERYLVLHAFALVIFFLVTPLLLFVVEGLWRLGLWLMFPNILSQYLQAMAEYSYKPNFAVLIIILLTIFFAMNFVFSNTVQ